MTEPHYKHFTTKLKLLSYNIIKKEMRDYRYWIDFNWEAILRKFQTDSNIEAFHEKAAECNSHAVISMKNGNQVHSQHMDKGRRSNQLLEKQSLQIKHAFIMSI